MSKPVEALASEVMQLRTADRIRLLDRVVASLDADAARDAAWNAVAAQREAEIELDESAAEPLEAVLVRLRAQTQ